jgi:hypothetical protein
MEPLMMVAGCEGAARRPSRYRPVRPPTAADTIDALVAGAFLVLRGVALVLTGVAALGAVLCMVRESKVASLDASEMDPFADACTDPGEEDEAEWRAQLRSSSVT